MDLDRFNDLLLKDLDHTLTRAEFIEYHEMLHILFAGG